MTDTQKVIAYLGQAALLLRRRAHKKITPDEEATRLVETATAIQRLVESVERIGESR